MKCDSARFFSPKCRQSELALLKFSAPKHRIYKTRQTGFTLIELVLVVVLLGVVVSLSVPNLRGSYKSILLSNVTSHIASLMRYAQARAIIKKTPVNFICDRASGRYYIAEQNYETQDSAGNALEERIPGPWGRTFRIPQEIECDVGIPAVGFYPDGSVDETRLVCCLSERCVTISTKDQRRRILLLEGRVE